MPAQEEEDEEEVEEERGGGEGHKHNPGRGAEEHQTPHENPRALRSISNLPHARRTRRRRRWCVKARSVSFLRAVPLLRRGDAQYRQDSLSTRETVLEGCHDG